MCHVSVAPVYILAQLPDAMVYKPVLSPVFYCTVLQKQCKDSVSGAKYKTNPKVFSNIYERSNVLTYIKLIRYVNVKNKCKYMDYFQITCQLHVNI